MCVCVCGGGVFDTDLRGKMHTFFPSVRKGTHANSKNSTFFLNDRHEEKQKRPKRRAVIRYEERHPSQMKEIAAVTLENKE